MKELNHREIQLALVDILQDVHDFCTANGLRYSLAYGTLIGAVRHKGFIPWDDDIDLIMPRPDFERFVKEYNSRGNSRYECIYNTLREDTRYVNYFAKVQDTRTLSTENKSSFKHGLNIDIFPIDGKPGGSPKEQCRWERHLCHLTHRLRLRFHPIGTNPILAVIHAHFHSPQYWFEKCRDEMMRYDFDSSDLCGAVGIKYEGLAEVAERSVFESYTDILFEGRSFKAVSDWDSLLTRQFGDYMTPPPPQKRVCHELKVYLKDQD